MLPFSWSSSCDWSSRLFGPFSEQTVEIGLHASPQETCKSNGFGPFWLLLQRQLPRRLRKRPFRRKVQPHSWSTSQFHYLFRANQEQRRNKRSQIGLRETPEAVKRVNHQRLVAEIMRSLVVKEKYIIYISIQTKSIQFNLVVQKRMLKSSLWGQSVFRVQGQTVLQKVSKVVQILWFLLKSAVSFEHSQQLSFGSDAYLHLRHCHWLGVLVIVAVEKVELWIEVLIEKFTFFKHFNTEFSFCFHYQPQHIVVWFSLKQELSGEYLKKTTANSPSVDPITLFWRHLAPQYDLWSTIVPSHQVLNFCRVLINAKGSSEVSQFDIFEVQIQQKVIGFDVCVNRPAFSELVQTQEHRDCVLFDMLQSYFILVFASEASEVGTQQLADQKEVTVLMNIVEHLHDAVTLPHFW